MPMKNYLRKALLLIGMFCVSLFLMSAEAVTDERHSIKQQQELSIDNVDVELQVVNTPLIAFGRTTEMLPLNEEEVEISYGNLTNNYRYSLLNDKQNVNRVKLTYQLEIIRTNDLDGKVQKQRLNEDNYGKDVEHRIRGIPTNKWLTT